MAKSTVDVACMNSVSRFSTKPKELGRCPLCLDVCDSGPELDASVLLPYKNIFWHKPRKIMSVLSAAPIFSCAAVQKDNAVGDGQKPLFQPQKGTLPLRVTAWNRKCTWLAKLFIVALIVSSESPSSPPWEIPPSLRRTSFSHHSLSGRKWLEGCSSRAEDPALTLPSKGVLICIIAWAMPASPPPFPVAVFFIACCDDLFFVSSKNHKVRTRKRRKTKKNEKEKKKYTHHITMWIPVSVVLLVLSLLTSPLAVVQLALILLKIPFHAGKVVRDISFRFSLQKDVKNETVLITGGGGVLGSIMAVKFAELGAKKIALLDINQDALEAAKEKVEAAAKKAGGNTKVYILCGDLSKEETTTKAMEEITAKIGEPITILINNAGIVTGKKVVDAPAKLIS